MPTPAKRGATGAALDIHETAGSDYKSAVRDTFLWCASHYEHWRRVPCVDAEGARYSKAELSEVLWARLAGDFVNKKAPPAGGESAAKS